MKKLGILLLCVASVTALAVGCGDETDGTTTTTTTSSSSTGGGAGGSGGSGGNIGFMPIYGKQIDRFGRPAINTAANHVADPDMATKGAAKDAWNANSDPATWGKAYVDEIKGNLAVFDALDGVCGNQVFADKVVSANRYVALAGALADDRQWLNTANATCTAYLAVEANALMLKANTDCGGRGLAYDVIDESYTLLAKGPDTAMPPMDPNVYNVTDGIPAPSVGTVFPYLDSPLP